MKYLVVCCVLISACAGEDGKNGLSCTIESNDNQNHLICEDGTIAILPDDGASNQNGTRLQARFYEAEDGSKEFIGWYDSVLETNCQFEEVYFNEDKSTKTFCLPLESGDCMIGHTEYLFSTHECVSSSLYLISEKIPASACKFIGSGQKFFENQYSIDDAPFTLNDGECVARTSLDFVAFDWENFYFIYDLKVIPYETFVEAKLD